MTCKTHHHKALTGVSKVMLTKFETVCLQCVRKCFFREQRRQEANK